MDAAGHLQTVTKFTGEVNDPDNVPEAIANAFRAASLTGPTPIGPLGPAPSASIARAIDLIRGASRPALLVGARGADPDSCAAIRELIAGAELPVVETFQAAGVVSRALEHRYLGRVGLSCNQPGAIVIAHADVVIAVGYDPVEYDPSLWNGDVLRTIIHIDSHPADIDNHYQPTLELRGDVAATITEFVKPLAGLAQSEDAADEIESERRRLAEIDAAARETEDGPTGLNPAAVCLQLRDVLDDEATVACDVGTHYIHMARHFRVYQPRHLLFSNGQQTLGVALPWAMAATLVRPETQVVSVSGDGGFPFSAQGLETAHRHDMTFTHVLMRDNTYDMVGFQEVLKYGRKSGVQLGGYDIVSYAQAFGAHGYRVGTREELAATLRHALAEPGPSIIDVPVDYSHSGDLAADIPGNPFE